ncbi:DUF4339 domain-containing protein [Rariglobus hedericola]
MPDQTWIAVNQEQKGPFSADELRAKMAAAEINGLTLYWQEGMSGWRELREWQEVFSSAPAQAAATTTPTFRASAAKSFSSRSDDVIIREEHIKHEAALRSVGTLYYIGGVLIVFACVAAFTGRVPEKNAHLGPVVQTIMAAFAVIAFVMGRMFRKLTPSVKVPGTVMAVIGLINFPIGTLINAYILYLIHSAKGKVVLSPEYKDIIAATPQIKYKTSIIVKICVVLLILMLLLAVVGTAISGYRKG